MKVIESKEGRKRGPDKKDLWTAKGARRDECPRRGIGGEKKNGG